jgi:alkylhydroperoxidase/carboxymuconolactone decarboxylase family protein YurZ
MPSTPAATTSSQHVTPDPITMLQSLDPAFHAGYVGARDAVMDDHPEGLSQREKELCLLTVDAIRGNVEAGTFHALKAMEEGVALRGVLDALLLSFLVGGAATWGMTGMHIYAHCAAQRGTDPEA